MDKVPEFIEGVKNGKERLMGFGHRVYKNYDPRAKIIKKACDDVFEVTGVNPLLEIAMELEKIALEDDYFVQRKLYPNVDFYSGLIYEALQFPPEMFTVLFAIGRTPGWLAQWLELVQDKEQKIARPEADLHRRAPPRLRAVLRTLEVSDRPAAVVFDLGNVLIRLGPAPGDRAPASGTRRPPASWPPTTSTSVPGTTSRTPVAGSRTPSATRSRGSRTGATTCSPTARTSSGPWSARSTRHVEVLARPARRRRPRCSR